MSLLNLLRWLRMRLRPPEPEREPLDMDALKRELQDTRHAVAEMLPLTRNELQQLEDQQAGDELLELPGRLRLQRDLHDLAALGAMKAIRTGNIEDAREAFCFAKRAAEAEMRRCK